MDLYTNGSKYSKTQLRTISQMVLEMVSDHGSTALAVTYIGYGFKNPTNLGLLYLDLLCWALSAGNLIEFNRRLQPDISGMFDIHC